ncbi:VWA domain-containing protein [Uliginosibacterium sp. 31-16]|uniref:vWA domain-containing protein n=1 Tax=Uliginosibacterium sp. 31-16 TaxID=3068315 RepID=UPI00273DEA1D|nr:vWA domain-containing protein [Uliginosibacterium sp. 31-16]MDP5238041.1 VWA domain-containing protein [Uliginosibacterium sp. 31-16]
MRTAGFRKMQGQIAIMTGLLIIVLVGAVGLAIDSGLGYIIRAKLNGAVDAAAIAGARAVVIGNNQAEQTASAKAAAVNFFNANYANGYMNSIPTLNPGDISVTFDPPPNNGRITVGVTASARVPVNLMGVFGFDIMQVGSSAEAIRKDLDMAFVVDTTGSMSGVAGTVRREAKNFLTLFNATVDRVALMHFSSGGVLDVGFKPGYTRGFDRGTDINSTTGGSMYTKINSYRFEGWTNYAEGMWHARNQLNSIPSGSRSSLRVIVFFSDGSPNTISSFYTYRNASYCTQAGSIASNEGATGTPTGLFSYNLQDEILPGNCGGRDDDIWQFLSTTAALPEYYNAHAKTDQEFRFAPNPTTNPSGLRTVTNNNSTRQRLYTNINNASRNIAEQMAWKSRSEGIYVFTLGLGSNLTQRNGPNNELGSDVLKCMANTKDAPVRCRMTAQPIGEYCYAATTSELQPCFDRLASRILRLSK